MLTAMLIITILLVLGAFGIVFAPELAAAWRKVHNWLARWR